MAGIQQLNLHQTLTWLINHVNPVPFFEGLAGEWF